MRARLDLRDLVERMEEIRSRALPHFHKRLRDRLGELLNGAQVDPARLAQEAAILAERSDISEELVRLKTHADQADVLLSAEGETGKKLDFLLQEMNRETNTDPFENRRSGRERPGADRSRTRCESGNRPHPRTVAQYRMTHGLHHFRAVGLGKIDPGVRGC